MTDIKQQPVLVLKKFQRNDDESKRVYDLTRESVELLNNYVLDFFETINIINEKRAGPAEKDSEIDDKVDYVIHKIDSVTVEMRNIAHEMPELVELRYRDPVN